MFIWDEKIQKKRRFSSINKSQQEIIKFSAVNSLLKISNEKLDNSLPLIADAPTSSFDKNNLKHFTNNVGRNFDQVIIFSKDYLELNSTNEVIEKCKSSGGFWYVLQKVDFQDRKVDSNNIVADSEAKSIISKKV